MLCRSLVAVFCYFLRGATSQEQKQFPDGFRFGTGTSAYQVEGAWNVSDKSPSVWDHWIHQDPTRVRDLSNGDVACDSYHNYKRDIQMMTELGIDFYRFSLSWPRILPSGFPNHISGDGIAYYNNLIDELIATGIEPAITLYHWDLPQSLQDLGGWSNPLIDDWFADYARVVFEHFGDRVKLWMTINQPHQICFNGYGMQLFAPGLNMHGIGEYLCAHNLIRAHAKVYHLYDEDFRPTQGGRIGYVTATSAYYPATDSDEDKQAAEDMMLFHVGLYNNPIFSNDGDYPARVKELIAAKSEAQGYARSRLPSFTEDEIEYIKGTSDFYGMNHYTAWWCTRDGNRSNPVPGFYDDLDVTFFRDTSFNEDAVYPMGTPDAIRAAINYVREIFNDPEIMIIENGRSSTTDLWDELRTDYFRGYISGVLDAIVEDGANVTAYTAWSLMDNFEWDQGYTQIFGMYHVDFTSPERTRTARKSAFVYKEIIRSRVVDYSYEPEYFAMSTSSSNLVLSIATSEELKRFPKGFRFGAATSAYQIEGAWNISDKSPSIWDYWTHEDPTRIKGLSNGDVACDSYHNYKRDVQMLTSLGVDFYRFSVSWPRILPSGFSDKVSEDGIAYYNNLITELIVKGIEPAITLYHWDLPQSLQDLGGWSNPLIDVWFADYARVVFRRFSERVKLWFTINEPHQICFYGYGSNLFAPGLNMHGIGEYKCAYNIIRAHAKAYHVFDEEFRPTQGGRIGYVTETPFYYPAKDSETEKQAAEDLMSFYVGLYTHAIFSAEGNFPLRVKELIAAKSKVQGHAKSRLPVFTDEEVEYIKGTSDFYGLNYYYWEWASRDGERSYPEPGFYDDVDVTVFTNSSSSHDPYGVSDGLRSAIKYVNKNYNNPEIIVTENGRSDNSGDWDNLRADYFREHISAVLDAILEDGANVTGYTAWSLMDNFEWFEGYTQHFGLYQVDFTSPERTRIPRKSAIVYKEIMRLGVVDYAYLPTEKT